MKTEEEKFSAALRKIKTVDAPRPIENPFFPVDYSDMINPVFLVPDHNLFSTERICELEPGYYDLPNALFHYRRHPLMIEFIAAMIQT